jgi:hypothetical protein
MDAPVRLFHLSCAGRKVFFTAAHDVLKEN